MDATPILAVASLDDVSYWARSDGLEIVLIVTGAVLLTRFITWLAGRITTRIEAKDASADPLVRSEEAKHRHAVAEGLRWTAVVLAYFITGVLVLQRFGVPLTSLVAPATVAGVAVGFGAQRLVQDVLSGFFILAERQYGFGDMVRISPLGSTTGVTGAVEDVTLRVTRLRTQDGEVVIVPNGQIQQVTNLSRDWARAVVDVPVPASVDINRVTEILSDVAQDACADQQLQRLMVDCPSLMGVETIEANEFKIQIVARTLPGKQFDVGRELRSRIAFAFREADITVPTGLETAMPTGATT